MTLDTRSAPAPAFSLEISERLTIRRWKGGQVHRRDGEMVGGVLPFKAAKFARGIAFRERILVVRSPIEEVRP
jgi:hypothetical protein